MEEKIDIFELYRLKGLVIETEHGKRYGGKDTQEFKKVTKPLIKKLLKLGFSSLKREMGVKAEEYYSNGLKIGTDRIDLAILNPYRLNETLMIFELKKPNEDLGKKTSSRKESENIKESPVDQLINYLKNTKNVNYGIAYNGEDWVKVEKIHSIWKGKFSFKISTNNLTNELKNNHETEKNKIEIINKDIDEVLPNNEELLNDELKQYIFEKDKLKEDINPMSYLVYKLNNKDKISEKENQNYISKIFNRLKKWEYFEELSKEKQQKILSTLKKLYSNEEEVFNEGLNQLKDMNDEEYMFISRTEPEQEDSVNRIDFFISLGLNNSVARNILINRRKYPLFNTTEENLYTYKVDERSLDKICETIYIKNLSKQIYKDKYFLISNNLDEEDFVEDITEFIKDDLDYLIKIDNLSKEDTEKVKKIFEKIEEVNSNLTIQNRKDIFNNIDFFSKVSTEKFIKTYCSDKERLKDLVSSIPDIKSFINSKSKIEVLNTVIEKDMFLDDDKSYHYSYYYQLLNDNFEFKNKEEYLDILTKTRDINKENPDFTEEWKNKVLGYIEEKIKHVKHYKNTEDKYYKWSNKPHSGHSVYLEKFNERQNTLNKFNETIFKEDLCQWRDFNNIFEIHMSEKSFNNLIEFTSIKENEIELLKLKRKINYYKIIIDILENSKMHGNHKNLNDMFQVKRIRELFFDLIKDFKDLIIPESHSSKEFRDINIERYNKIIKDLEQKVSEINSTNTFDYMLNK